MSKEMFVKYHTREGNFNFLNTSEVSYSCYASIYDMDGDRLISCNFSPEYEVNGTDIDEVTAEIQESIERYWSTSDDRNEFIAFANENHDKIVSGTRKRRLAEIETELLALNEEKDKLLEANQ